MRVEVLKNFYDKQMKTLHRKGDLINVSEERAVEIKTVLSSYINILEDNETTTDLNSMTKKELIAYAELQGINIDARMNKSQIIEALEV